MDETKLYETMDNIIKESIWFSTNIDNNANVETLTQYCKRTKDGRTRKNIFMNI